MGPFITLEDCFGVLVYYFIVNDITSFLGYVLPWGQMSYRAATVITI